MPNSSVGKEGVEEAIEKDLFEVVNCSVREISTVVQVLRNAAREDLSEDLFKRYVATNLAPDIFTSPAASKNRFYITLLGKRYKTTW